jgi:hypothetical protein
MVRNQCKHFQIIHGSIDKSSKLPNKACTHLTLGILRKSQAFFWLRVFPAPKQKITPPQI